MNTFKEHLMEAKPITDIEAHLMSRGLSKDHIATREIDLENLLLDRGIDSKRTRVIMDKTKNVATFLLFNLSGKLVGYQFYNPNGSKIHNPKKVPKDVHPLEVMKYFTRITKQDNKNKEIGVYGLESYKQSDRELWIVEGIFDCTKLHNQGLTAIAILANDPKPFGEWLRMLPQRKIVIYDNDKAGKKLAKYGDEAYTVPEGFNDLGDMTDDEVAQFIKDIR